MSGFFSLDFELSDIGRGMKAFYCWRSDCLCPAGFVILCECGDGSKGNVSQRIRADILHIYVPEWTRGHGIGTRMIEELKLRYHAIHTPVTESKDAEELFVKCGFVHDESLINWHWCRNPKPILVEGFQVDSRLAHFLGWTNIEVRDEDTAKGKEKILVGLPANSKSVFKVPMWSSDKAAALGLLVDFSIKHNLNYQSWKIGGRYCCGFNDEPLDPSSPSASSWYENMALSICHAMILFFEKRLEQDDNDQSPDPSPVSKDDLDHLRDESIELLRQKVSDLENALADEKERVEVLKQTDKVVRQYSEFLKKELEIAQSRIPFKEVIPEDGSAEVDAFAKAVVENVEEPFPPSDGPSLIDPEGPEPIGSTDEVPKITV